MARIKVDNCLSPAIKRHLVDLGHDAETAADEGLSDDSDEILIAHAKAEGRIIFSVDRRFRKAQQYPPGTHAGMVWFGKARNTQAQYEMISDFIDTHDLDDLSGCVVRVESDGAVVFRPPPAVDEADAPAGA